jgi:vancomycin resistance protein VanW
MTSTILRGGALRPKQRSRFRLAAGKLYFTWRRYARWYLAGIRFAHARRAELLAHPVFAHASPLLRELRNVDMWLQHNKVHNLALAVARLNGVVVRPGETLSYWRSIGKPSARKGYKVGMILFNGEMRHDTGGGLCQLSNLIYWMTIHSALTVCERHRHSFDVFPDSNRTQPFGSGATCAYNYIDLMIRNDTSASFQLHLWLTGTELHGEWRSERAPTVRYEVYEREHRIVLEWWGGYSRHNEIHRRGYDVRSGQLVTDELVTENHAVMMYNPMLPP